MEHPIRNLSESYFESGWKSKSQPFENNTLRVGWTSKSQSRAQQDNRSWECKYDLSKSDLSKFQVCPYPPRRYDGWWCPWFANHNPYGDVAQQRRSTHGVCHTIMTLQKSIMLGNRFETADVPIEYVGSQRQGLPCIYIYIYTIDCFLVFLFLFVVVVAVDFVFVSMWCKHKQIAEARRRTYTDADPLLWSDRRKHPIIWAYTCLAHA